MTKTIVLLAAICACCSSAPTQAAEGDLYAIATLRSLHQDRSHGYYEKNLGVGLQYDVNSDVKIVLGEYKNSFKNKSEYYGIGYLPFHRGNFSAGTLIVKVNGYDFENLKKFLPIAVPTVSYEQGKFLANFVVVPPIHKDGIVAVQVGWKFNE